MTLSSDDIRLEPAEIEMNKRKPAALSQTAAPPAEPELNYFALEYSLN